MKLLYQILIVIGIVFLIFSPSLLVKLLLLGVSLLGLTAAVWLLYLVVSGKTQQCSSDEDI